MCAFFGYSFHFYLFHDVLFGTFWWLGDWTKLNPIERSIALKFADSVRRGRPGERWVIAGGRRSPGGENRNLNDPLLSAGRRWIEVMNGDGF